MSYIAEAITEAFGDRCPDFEPGCHCCRSWAEFDALSGARNAALEEAAKTVELICEDVALQPKGFGLFKRAAASRIRALQDGGKA